MIKHFRPDCVNLFGRAIKNEPPEFSRGVLSAVLGDDFPNWFRGEITRLSGRGAADLLVDGEEPPMPEEEFTEKSFRDSPKAEMKMMRDTWRGLTPREASNPAVWTHINLRMIEAGCVKPWFFASGGNGKDSSPALIEKTLRGGSDKRVKELARSVSRFLTGYVPERSIRPLYANCPPARAWWMWHLAEQAAQAKIAPEVDADHVFGVLKEKWVWAELTEKIVSELTVVGDVNVRHGVIRFLLSQEGPSLRGHKRFRSLLLGVGEMSSWRALGFFGPDRISDILKDEIVPALPAAGSDEPDNENGEGAA